MTTKRAMTADKGQRNQVAAFVEAVAQDRDMPIGFESLARDHPRHLGRRVGTHGQRAGPAMSRDLGWYVRRLRRMSAAEVAGRVLDAAHRRTWAHRQVHAGDDPASVPGLRTRRPGPAVPVPP